METGQGQFVVRKRVRQRWPKEQHRWERDEGPIEMSKWRRRRGWKNRSAHTGTRQPVRGEEPTPTVGEMRFGFCASPTRQRCGLQNQKSAAVVHVRHSVVGHGQRPPSSAFVETRHRTAIILYKAQTLDRNEKINNNNKYKLRYDNIYT